MSVSLTSPMVFYHSKASNSRFALTLVSPVPAVQATISISTDISPPFAYFRVCRGMQYRVKGT